jgi:hypothetical protein
LRFSGFKAWGGIGGISGNKSPEKYASLLHGRFNSKLCRGLAHLEKIKLAVVDVIIFAAHQHACDHAAVLISLRDGVNLLPLKHALYRSAGRQMLPHVR